MVVDAGRSYRKTQWVPGKDLWEHKAQLLRNFLHRRNVIGADEDEDDRNAGIVNGVNPDWMVIDRVIAQDGKGADLDYLVKWCSLPYSECTWEPAKQLSFPEDKVWLWHQYQSGVLVPQYKLQGKDAPCFQLEGVGL